MILCDLGVSIAAFALKRYFLAEGKWAHGMSNRLSDAEAARYGRAGWRGSLAVLSLLACLVIAGCAQRAASTGEEQRQGGFYGGMSAGNGM